MHLVKVLLLTAVLATVDGAVIREPSHEQQPFDLPSSSPHKQLYNVRRFQVSSQEDKLQILRLAQKYDIDIWGVTNEFVDLYFGDPIYATVVHGDFALRNSTTHVVEWIHPLTTPAYAPSYLEATPEQQQESPEERVFCPKRTANKAKIRKNARKNRDKDKKKSPSRPRPYPHPNTSPWNVTTVSNSSFHEAFHTYTEINTFSRQLAEEFPDLVEFIELGRSSEGRDILALNIARPGRRKHRKGRMVVQGAQHAREWIATSTALYFAHSLVTGNSDYKSKGNILDFLDITVIPLPNPDGYVYTWQHDRLWYKNRSPIGGGKCHGIDMNRNWGFEWEQGDEENPCSNWYPGSHAFQAPEVSAIASFVNRTPNIEAFIDLRSFGQMIMHPYSYSCDAVAPDAENLIEAALGAAKALTKTHGTKMATGAICDQLYRAPGNVADWMYADAKITMTYSVMLRDTGVHGFLLPAKYIRPVGEEVADMIQYLSRWMQQHKF